jgi:hypothetical protein
MHEDQILVQTNANRRQPNSQSEPTPSPYPTPLAGAAAASFVLPSSPRPTSPLGRGGSALDDEGRARPSAPVRPFPFTRHRRSLAEARRRALDHVVVPLLLTTPSRPLLTSRSFLPCRATRPMRFLCHGARRPRPPRGGEVG